MHLISLPSHRSFRLLICLFLVTAFYCYYIVRHKSGEIETPRMSTRHRNQTALKISDKERYQSTKSQSIKIVLDAAYADYRNMSIPRDSPVKHAVQLNPVKETSSVCYVSHDQRNVKPLDDFIKYPCLQGLTAFTERNWTKPVKCVRVYCHPDLNNQNTTTRIETAKQCVVLKTPRGKTPICIHPSQTDVHVSASLKSGGQWEGPLVANLAKFIKAKSGTVFLDIGCNIGAYTVSMAHLGINVTAIDPMLENLELLSKSLVLGNLQDNVTLIWNAASNAHTLVKFRADQWNIGGTRVIDVNASTAVNDRSYVASTIMLDDLIPLFKGKRVAIKIDVEESEYNALLGGSRFLNETDVLVIQIEYLFHKIGKDGPKIFSYLASKGFSPYRDLGRRSSLKSTTMRLWPNDLYYMKP